ncbi:hypothetical protein AGABI2DRAFT_120020 [Agaricus bisporus var. bisporus H97]|uniref:hypothetical protein n=1 Tax=Agaricus bisporus var. bisporus (strain H97 / ATCC MYA-4626 / FGSC 10389) TaxID=936046 RepID=UPI00029F55B9|nr:hypothetical protein AGABI2DRAFT_120020 [Agaricus bisporus var. bisporus H97]EKV45052.1 hypothetical protein AGABI2DRAFT_120020 [Agaricus bisporus var. bisporus H97]
MTLSFEDISNPVIAAVTPTSPLEKAKRIARQNQSSIQIWYFLASFIFMISVINCIDIVFAYFRARRQRRRLAQTSSTSLSLRGSIDLLRLPLALTDTFRALSFRWTIPIGRSYSLNVMQVILTGIYIAALYSWSLINSDLKPGQKAVPRDWANTTGRVAAVQLPLIVGLGMKNNLISLLTGVSFDKHGISRGDGSYLAPRSNMDATSNNQASLGMVGDKSIIHPDVQAGVLAAIALTLLCIVWIRPVRSKAYEIFLVAHLIFAFMIILTSYFHLKRRNSGELVWPAMVLWALDRVIRFGRLAISFFTGRSASTTESPPEPTPRIASSPKIELLPGHLIRLTTTTPKFFRWRPGQSAYLTLPKISRTPLEGHPFTISTIDTDSSQNSELKFLIQVRKGFTKRLYDADETKTIGTILVDGPYSTPPRLVGYDSILLIAGGTGVSFALPLMLDVVERSKNNGIVCRRLTLVWAVRQLEHIAWIEDDLLDALKDIPANLTINIHIFVASEQNDIEDDPEKLDDDTLSKAEKENGSNSDINEKYNVSSRISSLPMIKVYQERADFSTFIKDEVAQAHDCMSVNVCGSEKMNRMVRESIRTPRMADILRGGPTISLHVESFENAVRVYSF